MNVAVIGAGHVGLVAAACLADFGLSVTSIDCDENRIGMLQRQTLPFFEPGLQEVVNRNFSAGRLTFSTDLGSAVRRASVIFMAVGTEGADGGISVDGLLAAARQLVPHINEYKIIAIKSTVPVGTANSVGDLIRRELQAPAEIDMVSNPEFLREGSAVEDFMRPDRVILDTLSHRSLVDACRLAGVQLQRFKHNDMDSLRQEIASGGPSNRTLVISDGVFSMDGDFCPLPDLLQVKRDSGCFLMIDASHASGVLGAHGRGTDEQHDSRAFPGHRVDLLLRSADANEVPRNAGRRHEPLCHAKHADFANAKDAFLRGGDLFVPVFEEFLVRLPPLLLDFHQVGI
mgnify:CR=1 FL=1